MAFLLHWLAVPLPSDVAILISPLFFHEGALPFFINVLFLWLFGDNVEDQTGRSRFVVLYGLSGMSGAVMQAVLDPDLTHTLIGASGTVSGVLGAYFLLYPRSRILLFFPLPPTLHELPAAFFLGAWFPLHLLILAAATSLDPQLSDITPGLAAHATGFGTGALLCLLLRRAERTRVEWRDS